MSHPLLCAPWFTGIIEHIRHLVTGFITMPIQALCKHRVEARHISLLASHHLHESIGIMRHIPGIMAGSPLGDKRHTVYLIGVIQPLTITVTAVCPASTWIDDITPVGCPLHQEFVILIHTQLLRSLGQGKVIIGIFQCPAHLLMGMECLHHTVFHRDIPILQITVECAAPHAIAVFLFRCRRLEGVLTHRLISLLRIQVVHPFDDGIRECCHTMIADHRRRITVPTREDG